jgi:hypothetical protein
MQKFIIISVLSIEETVAMKPNYRDAYYALAVLYRQKATGGTDKKVTDPAMQKKAEDTVQFILTNLSPGDKESEKLLKSWKS